MDRPPLEVADLVPAAGDAFIERSRKWITWKHVKVLLAIARCRTAALGGHLDECTRCGHRAISFNSCRNRHCPKCQTGARDRWLEKRRRELIPTPYLHVVFTLPRQLASLALQNKKVVYDLLFRTSATAAQRPTSPKARAASGNACTTTGPIPTASSSRRPTPTCGEARRATPTPSRVSPTARPTLTWSSRRQEPQGMGARLGAGDHRQARCGKGV